MRKVLVVLEDYNELIFTEGLLKKIGFDCEGIQNLNKLSEVILTFSPHLVIVEGFGRRLNGLQISQKIKRTKGFPKVLLITESTIKVKDDDLQRFHIDGVIERPLLPAVLIEKLAQSLSLDYENLKNKIEKMGLFGTTDLKDGLKIVSGQSNKVHRIKVEGFHKDVKNNEPRHKRFEKAVNDLETPQHDGINRSRVLEQTKDFRSREDDPEIMEIDEERLGFVREMFKK